MCFREYDLPYGLYVSLCTLRVAVTSFHATLGMGGWLSLTQPGLPPGKNAPSLLGALTFRAFATQSKRQPLLITILTRKLPAYNNLISQSINYYRISLSLKTWNTKSHI